MHETGRREVSEHGERSGADQGSMDGDGARGPVGLRETMMRADYVNSLNVFNQLPVSEDTLPWRSRLAWLVVAQCMVKRRDTLWLVLA